MGEEAPQWESVRVCRDRLQAVRCDVFGCSRRRAVKERRRSSAYALCGAAYGTRNAARNRGSMRHVLAHVVGAVRDVCKLRRAADEWLRCQTDPAERARQLRSLRRLQYNLPRCLPHVANADVVPEAGRNLRIHGTCHYARTLAAEIK